MCFAEPEFGRLRGGGRFWRGLNHFLDEGCCAADSGPRDLGGFVGVFGEGSHEGEIDMDVYGSMKPGKLTYLPVASMTSAPLVGAQCFCRCGRWFPSSQ